MSDIVGRLLLWSRALGEGQGPALLKEAAAEIERIREERRWVSVEERLPEEDVKVLTMGLQKHPVVCSFWHSDGVFRDGGIIEGVTHWMPLPAPPEERS